MSMQQKIIKYIALALAIGLAVSIIGGILGVIPKRIGIGVYAPALDKHGNSMAGVRVLAKLSEALDLNIY